MTWDLWRPRRGIGSASDSPRSAEMLARTVMQNRSITASREIKLHGLSMVGCGPFGSLSSCLCLEQCPSVACDANLVVFGDRCGRS
jgi:hypothetical protein